MGRIGLLVPVHRSRGRLTPRARPCDPRDRAPHPASARARRPRLRPCGAGREPHAIAEWSCRPRSARDDASARNITGRRTTGRNTTGRNTTGRNTTGRAARDHRRDRIGAPRPAASRPDRCVRDRRPRHHDRRARRSHHRAAARRRHLGARRRDGNSEGVVPRRRRRSDPNLRLRSPRGPRAVLSRRGVSPRAASAPLELGDCHPAHGRRGTARPRGVHRHEPASDGERTRRTRSRSRPSTTASPADA